MGNKPTINNTIQRSKEAALKATSQARQTANRLKEMIPEHENIYTIPNMLTLTRLVSAPVIGFLILKHKIWLSFILFAYSSITDFIDGYIARRFNMKSVVGSIIDPMADKALMVICTACLATIGQMPLYLATIILGRDALLALSAIYYRYISLPSPKTFVRFWDFSIPSAQVYPTTISKYNTLFQMVYIAGEVLKPAMVTLIDPANIAIVDTGFQIFGGFVGMTTILSGLSYVFSKDAVKILTKKQ
jgi:cardiolipin synthase